MVCSDEQSMNSEAFLCLWASVLWYNSKVEMEVYVGNVVTKIAEILTRKAEPKPSVSSSKACCCPLSLPSAREPQSPGRKTEVWSSYEDEDCFINRERKREKYNAD